MPMERTVALIKPDAVKRKLAGKFIEMIDTSTCGLVIEDIRLLSVRAGDPGWGWSPENFYGRQHKDKPYFGRLVQVMSEGPVYALRLSGDNAIENWRLMLKIARDRYMLPGVEPAYNLLHGSDSMDSYIHEAAWTRLN